MIKDFFIRGFCRDKMGGFMGLKGYAMASEDRELEGKLAMVEKFNKRIPELVRRIYDRAQKNLLSAGESDRNGERVKTKALVLRNTCSKITVRIQPLYAISL